MKTKIISFLMLALLALGFSSCDKNDIAAVTEVPVIVELKEIEGLDQLKYGEGALTFLNRTTGREYSFSDLTPNGNRFSVTLPEGFYDLSYEGRISYQLSGTETEAKAKALSESLQLLAPSATVSITPFLYDDKADFVIEEIFFNGTLKPDGKAYIGDAYFKITNNSDRILYADGLGITESAFLTNTKYDYTPNIMNEAFTIQTLYVIPGDGESWPVQPGASLIICDQAINHKAEANENSFDLTGADFEWYDESTNSTTDVDNPDVPNLEKIYSYTKSIWIPSKQGNRAYALVRFQTDKDTYLTDYKYDYSYQIAGVANTTEKTGYQIPNDWIVDAVNVGTTDKFVWIVTTPSIDMGWATCGSSTDANRYGKSVRRKVVSVTPDGRRILQDTGNSSFDFESKNASLMN